MNGKAQRDSYRLDLRCPQCGKTGTAAVSEEDYPFTQNRHFSLDSLTPGFRAENVGNDVTKMKIICSDCDVSARPERDLLNEERSGRPPKRSGPMSG